MARLPQVSRQAFNEIDPDLMEMLAFSQATEAIAGPPAMEELLKLLEIASEMQNQEQDIAIKRQALDQEQQKAAMTARQGSISTVGGLPFIKADPMASRNLAQMALPGLEMSPPLQSPAQGPGALPVSPGPPVPFRREPVTSQTNILGYQPPEVPEGVEAVFDEQGNVINFVRKGTVDEVSNFVPAPNQQSIGGWQTSKYAIGEQLNRLSEPLRRLFGGGR